MGEINRSIKGFVGRQEELKALKTQIQSKQPVIAVVYGRRRIGKSALVSKAYEGHPLFVFEGLEQGNKAAQISNFLFQLALQTGRTMAYSRSGSWKEALILLYRELEKKPRHLFFDEFQWMANYRQDLVIELKMVWEQFFSKIPGLSLVLCGSIASFMIKKVIKSNALYGRIDLQIPVNAFTLPDSEALLRNKGKKEVVEAQLFTGGVPKYLDIIRGAPSVMLAMQTEGFTASGYFFNEHEKIFTSHFGRNKDYGKIIQILADHPFGLFRIDIINKMNVEKGGQISEQLYNLEKAGFISSAGPFHKPASSKLKKYFLSDMYLRFYYAFILPNRERIKAGVSKNILLRQSQSGRYFNWLGRSFELMCWQHAYLFPKLIGFEGVEFDFGPYYAPSNKIGPAVQADLVFSRADNVMTVCEMKYKKGHVGTDVLEEVEKRTSALQAVFPKKTIQNILVTINGATKELLNSAYFYRVISLEDFFIPK